MKVKGLKVIGIMVAVSGSVVMAQTEAPAPGAAGQGRQGGGARMLERFDTDGDGVLSDAERTAMEASRGTRRRGATAEAVAPANAAEAVVAPVDGPDPKVLMAEFDGNKDGVLNEAELAKLLVSLKRPVPAVVAPAPAMGPGAGMQNREAMMEQYDANKDGQLDETERAAMMEAMRARMGDMGGAGMGAGMGMGGAGMGGAGMGGRGAMTPEMMTQYDKDGNGELSDEERTAMREAMRAGRMRPAGATQ